MIEISNDGAAIAYTNYFDTELARAGYFYVSYNAGAARLLVPDSRKTMLDDMRTGRYVIVSTGPWKDQQDRSGLELLFEDGTDSPFCLHLLVQEQSDRVLPETDQGSSFIVAAWTREGKVASWPGKYRRVGCIPCLEPWQEH
ncbi:hypothetical protein NRY95_05550 [Xanthomonas campestris pv. phormiicola]|nr:hypothetical protein [Xanthomonas campestris pv. phormiicola]UYC17429.1 hypothetical protein NRY95_05550 [Xanthomonas campestris pv. phormiicola]